MADQPPPVALDTMLGGAGARSAVGVPAAAQPSTSAHRDQPTGANPSGDVSGDACAPADVCAPADSCGQAAPGECPGDRRESQVWRGGPLQRSAFAAIDLGTNNCRLLIARPAGDNFIVVDAFSRVVRLGEGLAQTGKLSQEAMDRALGALQVCADKLRRRNVQLARSVATEACRRASNGMEFIERVRQETGIAFDVISAREEARLAVLGCHILLEPGFGPALVFDIGGGSTELVLIESGPGVPRILDWISVPWGVVSLTETFGDEVGGEASADEAARLVRYARMRETVAESFSAFAERVAGKRAEGVDIGLDGEGAFDGEGGQSGGGLRLLGTSGTVTTLASLHLDLAQYDRRAVDGLIVPAASMREISSRLSALSPDQRRELPCIGRERADLVVAGCAILETILDLWPAERLGVADRGIREGILRSLITAGGEGERLRTELRTRQQSAA
ncbi:MAG: exopolyphosphatase [Novosphingobium sp.]|nr:exopolyphosphatase [Novosphingobium sp.]